MHVGVIYYNSIYEKTGAGTVARIFLDEEGLFANNEIKNITLYSLENAKKRSTNNIDSIFKGRLRKLISACIHKFYVTSCFQIKRTYFALGNGVLQEYLTKSNKDEDLLVFHEMFSCNAYLDYCENCNVEPKKYVLIEHSNGEPLKMLHIYFPKIVGKPFDEVLSRIFDRCEDQASKIVLVSNSSLDTFRKRRPELAYKSIAIPNGIGDLMRKPKERNYEVIRLVTVGTVNDRKNQIKLIETLGDLKDSSFHLTVVGAGSSLETCKKKAKELMIENRIDFLGARDDVPEILEQENVFIMASKDEGLPIAALEAMRSGMPLVLSDVGGNNELIEDNGYLYNLEKDDLVNILRQLLENSKYLHEMGENSYKLFQEKYNIKAMVESYARLFKDTVEIN